MDENALISVDQSRFVARMVRAQPQWRLLIWALSRQPLDRPSLQRLLDTLRGSGDFIDEAHLKRVLRQLRNQWLCAIVERDLNGSADFAEVVSAMSHLAELALQQALHFLAASIASAFGVPAPHQDLALQSMIVVAMGKLGGAELNVSSDIDLVFVYGQDGDTAVRAGQKQISNHEFFIRLGRRLVGVLSEVTEDGFVFRVDMRLRPNGDAGPLAVSVDMLEEYFVAQGRPWERFAWIKARIVAPVPADAQALEQALDQVVRPFVYRRYLDFASIEALRSLHGQIRGEVTRRDAQHPDRAANVKLGRGGIREIEFIAQHFQLIRGGRDAQLRRRGTVQTLKALTAKGLLDAHTGARLIAAYVFLRNVEHRLQYLDDAQTHSLPQDPDDQARLARMCAALVGAESFAALLIRLSSEQAFVAAQFDAVFGEADDVGERDTARAIFAGDFGPGEVNDDAIAALERRGFVEAKDIYARIRGLWASARVRALPESVRERLEVLVPRAMDAVLIYLHEVPDASAVAVLGRLLDLFEAICTRGTYLALLREYPQALERVTRVLASSAWAARYLIQHPILLDEMLDQRAHDLSDWGRVAQELDQQMAAAFGDVERQLDILRETQHAFTFRLLTQDLEGRLPLEALSDHLSALCDLVVASALHWCWRALHGAQSADPRFAVIAYGKLGGKELGYASDLDLVFLYDDSANSGADPLSYARFGQRLMTWLTSVTAAGRLFDVDLRLRPDGASGLLVTGYGAYCAYQESAAWVWEHQALTRARFCAGDAALGTSFERERRHILGRVRDIGALRAEIITMRHKMHEGHPNASGLFDLKHDRGGMVDIEFCVQFLVLAHSASHPDLMDDIGNIALLARAAALGYIETICAQQVGDAYRTFRRRQHALRLSEARYARVAESELLFQREAVVGLWTALFGAAEGLPPSATNSYKGGQFSDRFGGGRPV